MPTVNTRATPRLHPVLCDLDGVVWLSHHPIPGSVEAIARLRAAGHRVLFVTNNSFSTLDEQVAALERIGVPAEGDVLTSSMAAATLVTNGDRVLVCGGPGIIEAMRGAGAEVVSHDEFDAGGSVVVDAVVVGFHRHFDYEALRRAARAVGEGARLIGANEDATYPTPDGEIPGGGSILAAIRTAAGVHPIVAGKPHPAMADLVAATVGAVDPRAVMVGDRLDTDGRFARALGCRFAWVRSGVVPPSADGPVDPANGRGTSSPDGPVGSIAGDIVAADLAGVAQVILGG